MAKSVKAKVRKEVLKWARTSAGLTVTEAAKRLKTDADKITAWEEGTAAPTVSQLQTLADTYKRPLSVLYLQDVPKTFQPMRDFRRLPGGAPRPMSPELALEIRLANQRRQLALELRQDTGDPPPRFSHQAKLSDSAEGVGQRIRKLLDVSRDDVAEWAVDRNGYGTFNGWRNKIEHAGVLAFQATRVSSEEVSGFAISADLLPVIVVTRTDTPPTRRTFTLLHEFAHLMLRVSGVTDLEESQALAPDDLRVEAFCNRVAAAALVPRDQFLAEEMVASYQGGLEGWSDDVISDLARGYGVSREMIVRRLLTFERTTEAFYQRKRRQYNDEYRRQREQERAKNEAENEAEKGAFLRNPPRETLSNYGAQLVNLILDSYYRDRLSLSDVSGYLGLRTRHIPRLEQLSGRRDI
ncbi:MAG: XRE family transcriptional regulator [Steroidobacteraceae bacterium]